MEICDFTGSRRIGAPRDWDQELDGKCHDAFVCDTVDTLSGLPIMYVLLKPSPAEVAAMMAGGALRIGFVGARALPVFNAAVLGPETCKSCDVVPVGDLGDEVIGD